MSEINSNKRKRSNNAGRSQVWDYFSKNKLKKVGTCNDCGIEIQIVNSGTNKLINHLKQQHGIDINEVKENDVDNGPSVKKFCSDVREEYSEMAAYSGLSFNSIAKSPSIIKGNFLFFVNVPIEQLYSKQILSNV
jgi:hypothetical protein